MKWLALCVFVSACSSNDTIYPIGVGDAAGGGHRDAAIDSAASGDGVIHGRVCLLTNPMMQQPGGCASTGATGLTVKLGTKTTIAAGDGSFAIEAATGDWTITTGTGPAIVTSHMLGMGNSFVIPAITVADFTTMKTATTVTSAPGQGSIVAWIVSNGVGLSSAKVASTPVSTYNAFYDGASWQQIATGTNGVAWIPGINVGSPTLATTPAMGSAKTSAAQPVFDGDISFVTIVF